MDSNSGKKEAGNANMEFRINDLEKRMSEVEKLLDQTALSRITFDRESLQSPGLSTPDEKDSIESSIGEYGMAWLGNIVLLFGILFFTQYLQSINRLLFSLIAGMIAVAGVYLMAYGTRGHYSYLSRLFQFNGHILLYLIAMQQHFFSESKLIENPWIGHGIVILVLIVLGAFAFRNKSQILIVVTWLMATVTAITSGHTHFMLPLITGIALSAVFFAIRKQWYPVLIISLFPVYFTFLVWILGNPFLTGTLKVIPQHQSGYIYLFTCGLVYSLLAALPASKKIPGALLNATIILNGLGFSSLIVLIAIAFFPGNFFIYFGMIAAFCLAYSIWLQVRTSHKYIAELYALYSFVALSITIAGIYHFPLAFFLLSVESLLVVSMALWFRSKFIVIMNSILFAGLLITYLVTSESIDSVNFAFALVALVTARILNWKKQRLEIRTEMIRNIYLFTGFVMVLWSLHDAVPSQFITLSWVFSAFLFFILGMLIPNRKYSWLAILTVVVSVFYLFLVDLENISLGYRIIALLIISVISLAISVYFARGKIARK